MKKIIFMACVGAGLAAHAMADPYSWVTWTGVVGNQAFGTINTVGGSVGVTLTGPFASVDSNYPSWTPAATWADGLMVDNAPDVHNIVHIDTTGSFSLTFSQSVNNLAFSVWSVGQHGLPVTYSFDHNLQFVAGGASAEYGGQSITTTANTLTGEEGNGTVLFGDSVSTLNFDVQNNENWHGFTVGLPTAVPEPASMVALGIGAIASIRRRRVQK